MRAAAPTVALLLATLASAGSAQRESPPCDPENAGLRLADGFCALLVADDLGQPRHFVVAPNGDLFVTIRGGRNGGGGIVALRDTDGDGRADVRERFGEGSGNGMALSGESLYYGTTDAVFRYTIPHGSLTPRGDPVTVVSGLPDGGHGAKSVAIGPDGRLFVNIGSRSNVCERRGADPAVYEDPCTELPERAGIWVFDANRANQTQADGERYATGLRNAYGIAFHPGGTLWAVVHGRDRLFQNWSQYYSAEDGAEKPSEILVEIQPGDDFGWPYCYHDRFLNRTVLAPEFGGDGEREGRCADIEEPVVGFPGHWAPDALAFYAESLFPERFRNGAFIAFHGSWNRAPLPQAGFNVTFQPLSAEGRPTGEFVVFADGFRDLEPNGRPAGVAVGPDGSLYVSDDAGGRIWRVLPAPR